MASFFTLKNIIIFLILVILAAGLVTSVRLVQQPTQLKSQAAACTVNQTTCSCGDTTIGDTRDPGNCSDCNGGWCNGGVCATCNAGGPPSCKETTICGQTATGNKPSDCTQKCDGSRAYYHCVQSDNSECVADIYCAPEDSRCAAGTTGGGGRTGGQQSSTGGQTGGQTGAADTAECESISIKDASGKLIYRTGQTPGGVIVAGQTYNAEITMVNRDNNKRSYQGSTWSPGNLSLVDPSNPPVEAGYFLGFPTSGDTGAGDFKTNKDTVGSSYSINTLWQIDWAGAGGDPAKLRIPLKNNVPAGSSNTFKVTIKPLEAGIHNFYWGMVHEEFAWFGGQCTADFQVDPVSAAAAAGSAAPAGSASPEPEAQIMFRIAEGNSEIEAVENLAFEQYEPYVVNAARGTMILEHVLDDPEPGQLVFIAVQFKKGTIEKEAAIKAIKFVGEKPEISSILCEYTAAGNETKVTIKGSSFGSSARKGTVLGKDNISILEWSETQISALIPEKISDKIKLKVKTADNQETEESECAVGVTTVDFTTITQCTITLTADNVDVKIFENNIGVDPKKPFHSQKIRLDGGKPQGLDVKLQEGKNYSLIIKAPKTLAKRVDFQALSGTTVLDQVVNLPIGDIAPASAPDGRINALDTSELKRQWSLIQDVTRTGDLNIDSRVNSIDYSCMKKDFDPSRADEVFTPPQSSPNPSLNPSPSPGLTST